MGPLPVHIAVIATAELGRGHVDERVGTALRSLARVVASQPVAERIDRGLHQGAAFGVELTAQDEHIPIGLLALEPAARVHAAVIFEHAIRIKAQPGLLGEPAHLVRLERLRRSHQDVLDRLHLLDAEVLGEVTDHGHVAEGRPP